MGKELTVTLVSAIVGAIFSLAFEVIPGLREWWAKLTDTAKRLGWLIGCLGVPLVMLALVCLANLNLGVVMPSCDVDGVVQVILIGGSAYLGGQGAYAVAGRGIRKRVNCCKEPCC